MMRFNGLLTRLPWKSLVAVAALFLMIGTFLGSALQERALLSRGAAVAEIDRKIEAWIVKRNPEASIKDFAGFPAFLMAESARANIDFRLVMAMIEKESRWKTDAVGSSGEIGLMQILPSTAADIAKRLGDQNYVPSVRNKAGRYEDLGSLRDPKTNIRYGIAYLAWSRDSFGMGAVALRGYNRNLSNAKQDRPYDRYAEEIAFKFMVLAHEIPKQ